MIYHQLLCPTIRSPEPGMIILHQLWPLLGVLSQESARLCCLLCICNLNEICLHLPPLISFVTHIH